MSHTDPLSSEKKIVRSPDGGFSGLSPSFLIFLFLFYSVILFYGYAYFSDPTTRIGLSEKIFFGIFLLSPFILGIWFGMLGRFFEFIGRLKPTTQKIFRNSVASVLAFGFLVLANTTSYGQEHRVEIIITVVAWAVYTLMDIYKIKQIP